MKHDGYKRYSRKFTLKKDCECEERFLLCNN